MSEKLYIDDELLGRWLAGELEGDELAQFESLDAYQTFQKIAQYSNDLESPEYNTELELGKLQESLRTSKKESPGIIKMTFFRKLAVAASVLLLIGLGTYITFFRNSGVENIAEFTAQGETKQIVLPDASTVDLNISSSIEYNPEEWQDKREIQLNGEGYFKVEKGSKFKVNTDHGSIEVLGTEFNIRNRLDITEVVCYEGKVKVTDLQGVSTILTAGMAVKIDDGEMNAEWKPQVQDEVEWKNGSSSFHNSPFKNVIQELENQYKIAVEVQTSLEDRHFTGMIPHNNLESALAEISFIMNLNYEIASDSVVIIR